MIKSIVSSVKALLNFLILDVQRQSKGMATALPKRTSHWRKHSRGMSWELPRFMLSLKA